MTNDDGATMSNVPLHGMLKRGDKVSNLLDCLGSLVKEIQDVTGRTIVNIRVYNWDEEGVKTVSINVEVLGHNGENHP